MGIARYREAVQVRKDCITTLHHPRKPLVSSAATNWCLRHRMGASLDTITFDILGWVGLRVTRTEQADGSLRFDLVNQRSQVGDLRGLFFNTNIASLLSKLSVTGSQVTEVAAGDHSIVNLGNGMNMQGVNAFDFGVAFGTSGIGKDDIQTTSFTLRSSGGALNLNDVAGVDFGVRFTSLGDLGGSRDGSLKLVGGSPETLAGPRIDFPPTDWSPVEVPTDTFNL